MSLEGTFASQIYNARTKRSLTQNEVAEAVQISVRWYQELEKGTRLPGAVVMLRLILFFGLNVEVFREEVGIVEKPSVYSD